MPTSQDITDQQRLLAQHRQNVQTLLEQLASQGGEIHASLNLRNTLADDRKEIVQRKAILRSWGVSVDDHPDDGDVPPALTTMPTLSIDQRRGNFITSGTFHGQVIGYQENHGGTAPAPVPAPAPARQADVLLVTVTDGETRAVFEALQARTGQRPTSVYKGDKTYYDLGHIGGAHTWLVRSEAGSVTVGGSFPTLYAAIDALRPAAILLVGIAFGTRPATHQLGDILVARQLLAEGETGGLP